MFSDSLQVCSRNLNMPMACTQKKRKNFDLLKADLFPFLQWAQQYDCLGLELPDQLPDISPGRLQWRLGSHKPTTLGVALMTNVII